VSAPDAPRGSRALAGRGSPCFSRKALADPLATPLLPELISGIGIQQLRQTADEVGMPRLRLRAPVAVILMALALAGCGSGGGGGSEMDATPEKIDGSPSYEFEQEDLDAAEGASDAVKEYCADAVSEAQRLGCESHVTEDEIP
jgi:hypothetical protein